MALVGQKREGCTYSSWGESWEKVVEKVGRKLGGSWGDSLGERWEKVGEKVGEFWVPLISQRSCLHV